MSKIKILLTFMIFNAILIFGFVYLAYSPDGQDLVDAAMHSVMPQVYQAEVTAVQAADFGTLDPHVFAPADQVALGLIYEPLIRFDNFLNLTPALASTWYWQDDTHLVTKLRSDVTFHDGSDFDCTDVTASLTRIQTYPDSGLRDLFSNVTVEPAKNGDCVFTLKQPDHNFLRKLTRLYVLPAEVAEAASKGGITKVIGTGRYQLVAQEKDKLTFKAFKGYYFYNAYLPLRLNLIAEAKKYNRLALLRDGQVDILLDAPAGFVQQIENRLGYDVIQVPSYESIFLIDNLKNKDLKKLKFRKQFAGLIRSLDLEKVLADQSLYNLTQFAPSGVFGFASELTTALDKVEPLDKKIFLTLGVTETNKKVAEILQAELLKKKVELSIKVLTEKKLETFLQAGSLDLYLLGWRYDLGAVDGFFAKLVHSTTKTLGELNGYGYTNKGTDTEIVTALAETTTKKRLKEWQDLMRKVVSKDVIGVPLLGTHRLYALKKGIRVFQPRMDGLMIFTTE